MSIEQLFSGKLYLVTWTGFTKLNGKNRSRNNFRNTKTLLSCKHFTKLTNTLTVLRSNARICGEHACSSSTRPVSKIHNLPHSSI